MADTGRLGGKVFKSKVMNEDRIWGLASLGFGGYLWSKFTCLSLMMGPLIPSVAVAGSLVYGMARFSDKNQISSIESLPNGELKITYCSAPLKSETITCHVNDTFSVCALGNDDLGADDVESNLLAIKKHSNSSGQQAEPIFLRVPADAFRDKQMMEWIFAKKDGHETTNDDFTDLLRENFEARVKRGGLPLLTAFQARTTGLAQFARENDVESHLENDSSEVDNNIRRLQELYGAKHLEELQPHEFYALYKQHSTTIGK